MFKTKKLIYNFAGISASSYVREGEPTTFTQEQVDALIAERIQTEVAGLKAKNKELIDTDKKLKETLAQFDGLDVAGLKALKAKIDTDQDVKDMAEGRTMEVIQRHTDKMREQHEKELKDRDDKISAAHQRADKYKQAVLDNEIRQAAGGLHKGAVDDALLHARTMFQLDENGKAVQIQDGAVVIGKDGKTPFGPSEWFEKMKEQKPHWYPTQTSGSGSGDARPAGAPEGAMKRSDFDALSPADRAKAATAPGFKITD